MEEWKQITDYPNYSVSNLGNVRNDKYNRNLKPVLYKCGYYYVGFRKNGKTKFIRIHRLVGQCFLENIDNKPFVDHVDRNKLNNNVNNLRWATRGENERNKPKKQNTKSKYKGVYQIKNNRWNSSIKLNGKTTHIGNFDTEEEAGLAYNQYIIENNLREYRELNILQIKMT